MGEEYIYGDEITITFRTGKPETRRRLRVSWMPLGVTRFKKTRTEEVFLDGLLNVTWGTAELEYAIVRSHFEGYEPHISKSVPKKGHKDGVN